MAYRVKEIFYTLQGEGANAGAPAVFCRFSGCNLWSGREQDRSEAECRFCDTDFLGGESYANAAVLALNIRGAFPERKGSLVVLTGGEPTLQVDRSLLSELHALGCYVAIETNGTRLVPDGVDWITVSPKAGVDVVQTRGTELKVVVPQAGLDWAAMESWEFVHRFVQPDARTTGSTEYAIQWAMTNPRWRVSFQVHKMVGLR